MQQQPLNYSSYYQTKPVQNAGEVNNFVKYTQQQSFVRSNGYPIQTVNSNQQPNIPTYSYPVISSNTNHTYMQQLGDRTTNTPPPLSTVSSFNSFSDTRTSSLNFNYGQVQSQTQPSLTSYQQVSPNFSVKYTSYPQQQQYTGLVYNNRDINATSTPINYYRSYSMPPSQPVGYDQLLHQPPPLQQPQQVIYTPVSDSPLSQSSNSIASDNINSTTMTNYNNNNIINNARVSTNTTPNNKPNNNDNGNNYKPNNNTNTVNNGSTCIQANDISVLTPIPGCMAYHHPLIPIIPSASGNTRKQALRLFDNAKNTSTSVNGTTSDIQNDFNNKENSDDTSNKTTGNENNGATTMVETDRKPEVRRMAFGSPTWTQKDDELLRHLKETEKIGWRDISMYFPTRTINACQFRWRRLIMKEENKKKKKLQKMAIKEKLAKVGKKLD